MDKRFKTVSQAGTALAFALATLAIATASGAATERVASLYAGQPAQRVLYAAVGDVTRPPIGWVEFCVEYKKRMRHQSIGAARHRAHRKDLERSDQGQQLGERQHQGR